jgi:hypothetical protein
MSIGAGGGGTCIINGIGQRFCAGANSYGQLGFSSTDTPNPTPTATVVPSSSVPPAFAVPPSFVGIKDASGNPVCSLLLSLKVAATCDPNPPVFSPPLANIVRVPTSAAGVVVIYNDPTAYRAGTPVPVTCTPASGSVFPIGTILVTCKAGVTTGTFIVGCTANRGGAVELRARSCGRLETVEIPRPRPWLPAPAPSALCPGLRVRRCLFQPAPAAASAIRSPRVPSPVPWLPPHWPLLTIPTPLTPPSQVAVAPPVPRFTSNGPASPFEATTASPYLGTTLAGKYAPNATDVVQGDVSAAIKTYLDATNAPIDLATYVLPLGATNIIHVVTNSFGMTAQQAVTVVVRDSTPPAVTVTGAAEEMVAAGPTVRFDFSNKVRPWLSSPQNGWNPGNRMPETFASRVFCCLRGSTPSVGARA